VDTQCSDYLLLLLAVIDITLFYKSAIRAVVTKTLSIDLGAFVF